MVTSGGGKLTIFFNLSRIALKHSMHGVLKSSQDTPPHPQYTNVLWKKKKAVPRQCASKVAVVDPGYRHLSEIIYNLQGMIHD